MTSVLTSSRNMSTASKRISNLSASICQLVLFLFLVDSKSYFVNCAVLKILSHFVLMWLVFASVKWCKGQRFNSIRTILFKVISNVYNTLEINSRWISNWFIHSLAGEVSLYFAFSPTSWKSYIFLILKCLQSPRCHSNECLEYFQWQCAIKMATYVTS